MLGLDASGKTTILYKLKLGHIATTIPTIGNCLRNSYLNEVYGTLSKVFQFLCLATSSLSETSYTARAEIDI